MLVFEQVRAVYRHIQKLTSKTAYYNKLSYLCDYCIRYGNILLTGVFGSCCNPPSNSDRGRAMVPKAALAVAQVLLIVALASGQPALGTLRGVVLDQQG